MTRPNPTLLALLTISCKPGASAVRSAAQDLMPTDEPVFATIAYSLDAAATHIAESKAQAKWVMRIAVELEPILAVCALTSKDGGISGTTIIASCMEPSARQPGSGRPRPFRGVWWVPLAPRGEVWRASQRGWWGAPRRALRPLSPRGRLTP